MVVPPSIRNDSNIAVFNELLIIAKTGTEEDRNQIKEILATMGLELRDNTGRIGIYRVTEDINA